jgi:hypothetical protein
MNPRERGFPEITALILFAAFIYWSAPGSSHDLMAYGIAVGAFLVALTGMVFSDHLSEIATEIRKHRDEVEQLRKDCCK